MAFIKQVDEADATGLLATLYEQMRRRAGRVFGIMRIQSQNPQAMQAGLGMYTTLMFGESPLSRAQREMMAVVVSRENECFY